MKKIAALILALVFIMGLSVTALAVDSPGAKPVNKVVIINGVGANKQSSTVVSGETVKMVSDSTKGTFNNWAVYKADGTKAVEGVDYVITSGSLKDATVEIKPLTDIIITGNYDGKVVNPITGEQQKPTSPESGDFAVVYMALIMLAAAACGFAAKKQLAK